MGQKEPSIPHPAAWSKHGKLRVLHVISMAQVALTAARARSARKPVFCGRALGASFRREWFGRLAVGVLGANPDAGARRSPPEVSSTALTAHLPDLQPKPLVEMDFAISCPLVRPGMPHIRFLFVRSRLCSTLPSDATSR